MRLLIGACTPYNKNTATENMNHCSNYCPIELTVYYMKWEQRRVFFPCSASLWSLETIDWCRNEWYLYGVCMWVQMGLVKVTISTCTCTAVCLQESVYYFIKASTVF